MRTKTKLALGVGLAGALATGLIVVAIPDSPGASNPTAPQAQLVAASRRDLADTQTVSGTVDFANATTLTASGVGTLTSLPKDGAVVHRGGELYRVDDVPVSLLIGKVPLWRDLYLGVSDGRDVKDVESNLAAMGYDPGTVDDHFTSSTQRAIEAFQADHGLATSGEVTRDRFVVQANPIRVGAATALLGAQLSPGTQLYGATSTTTVVNVSLNASDGQLAKVGDIAQVTLPGGAVVPAKITSVGSPSSSTTSGGASGGGDSSNSSAGSGDATIAVTLVPVSNKQTAGLSSAPVSVAFVRAQQKNVVAVPVTALIALSGGGFAVRLANGQLSAVTPGLYAGGYVQITQGLNDGQKVQVPRD